MTPFSAGPPDSDALTSRDFPVLWPVLTRWADNDMFGHLNNAVYYQLFDTAINGWLARETGIASMDMPAQGVVVKSGCEYFRELRFPQSVLVALRVAKIGRSSVQYELGLFP